MVEVGTKLKNVKYNKRKAVYAIVERDIDNKIAIATDNENVFFLLGGGSNKNETDIESLRRETIEETGYTMKNIKYFDSVRSWYYSDKYGYIDTEATIYTSKFDKKVTNPIEIDHKLLWISPEEYKNKLYHEYQRYILKKYVQMKGNKNGK